MADRLRNPERHRRKYFPDAQLTKRGGGFEAQLKDFHPTLAYSFF
jgi:hypothetical protein